MPSGDIIGIESLFIYRCCQVEKCCKKKVGRDFRCPSCSIQYTVNSAGYGGILKILINHDKQMTVFTMFTVGVKQLLSSLEMQTDLQEKDNILKLLKEKLPIRVKFSFQSTKITSIKAF